MKSGAAGNLSDRVTDARAFLFTGAVALLASANVATSDSARAGHPLRPGPASRPFVVGRITHEAISESSGVVASRRYPGVFWTINDSGNAAALYAIRRDGSLINAFPVHAVMRDWEDIAIDDAGNLYVGDIGNNNGRFPALAVFRITEPDPSAAPDAGKPLKPTRRWTLTFPPDVPPWDCESLFVWRGEGYLISKVFGGTAAEMFRFRLDAGATQRLERVATLPIRVPCTAAAISPDGDRLAVMTTGGPYLFEGVGGDLTRLATLRPRSIAIDPAGANEAVTFADGGLVGTSESRDVYFFPFDAFAPAPATQPLQ